MNREIEYLRILRNLRANDGGRSDRTGTGVSSMFGERMIFNLSEGFPLLTTKKMFFGGVVDELLWFISGSTNINDLPLRTRKWWKPWADANGELGPIYGEQLRAQKWPRQYGYHTKDQLASVIESLRTDPHSRRHVINLWNGAAMEHAGLPCCHGSVIQFYVEDGKLSCMMYQRSADIFLGVPVNIACYALLTHLIAREVGLDVGKYMHVLGDVHLYDNHREAAATQLRREPFPMPKIEIHEDAGNIYEITSGDILLQNYQSHPSIKAEVAI